jgi:UDPglucose--hexose-1-phosphate uridylyltransferase
MGELRKDPVSGRWVIIATERQLRPSDFHVEQEVRKGGFCPFCAGNEDKTPAEIRLYEDPDKRGGWQVRVVPNKFPALRVEGGLKKRGVGVYDMMNGVGAHEVVIETPEHKRRPTELSSEHFGRVALAYRDRLSDLQRDRRFAYGLVFKNVGQQAGASLEHTHSQIIVTPVVPVSIVTELSECRRFHDYRGRCLLCDIVQQELDDGTRVVDETDAFVALAPYASRFPFELWVMPKEHSAHFAWEREGRLTEWAGLVHRVLRLLDASLDKPPYNYMLHTTPFTMGEVEHYHWHLEITPRLTKLAGFEWGTGFYINTVAPEEAAGYLRNAKESGAAT